MKKYSKQEIIDEYNNLCSIANKRLTRTEYRNYNTVCSSTTIEGIWGSWNKFLEDANADLSVIRHNITKKFNKKIDKVVITFVNDGSIINEDFFITLQNYCKINKAELGILWGKGQKKNRTFDSETYDLLTPYLATRFEFEKDDKCIVQDFLIPPTQKNPLLNLDKLSTNINTIVVGANKQYLQILPYKQYSQYRIACSTGSLSIPEYKDTVAGHIDSKYHKFGAILLEWNQKQSRYVIRNLEFKNNCIYDLNKKYNLSTVQTLKELPGMVLGDLHLPDEDENSVKITKDFINTCKPKYTMLHDVASWNSVCHHNFGKCLFNAKNLDENNKDLKTELDIVCTKLNALAKDCQTTFWVVNSNHDAFIEKWLDNGDFVHDTKNAILGAKLFIKYCSGQHILDNKVEDNIIFLEKNKGYNICGFIISEHGDAGISGAFGSPNAFNKTFENCIVGHTHSPEIREKTFYVGTLSKLIVNYNQKGMTKWAHANAIIHENGTAQLILI